MKPIAKASPHDEAKPVKSVATMDTPNPQEAFADVAIDIRTNPIIINTVVIITLVKWLTVSKYRTLMILITPENITNIN